MKLGELKDGTWFLRSKDKKWYKRIGEDKRGLIECTQIGHLSSFFFEPQDEVEPEKKK